MSYTLEEIYILVGRSDSVAVIEFRPNSNSFKNYGESVTVLFQYTQHERETLDELIKNKPYSSHGLIKAKYLGRNNRDEKFSKLLTDGINSIDIIRIHSYLKKEKNTFHSREKRTIDKIIIPMDIMPKGGDLGWMYGFQKRLEQDGIGVSPYERSFYLACKLYFEPDLLKENEKNEIYISGNIINENVEYEFLDIKKLREDYNAENLKRLKELEEKRELTNIKLLNKYLNDAGSSLKKLSINNKEQADYMIDKVKIFKDKRLNVIGKIPIFIDIHSFLHIYLRHVEEMQVNKVFENKDNFQWGEEDIFIVMEKIIQDINKEIQNYFEHTPTKRFSKFGPESFYFEGDYYTIHIEPNGRISTFHKNKKNKQEVPAANPQYAQCGLRADLSIVLIKNPRKILLGKFK